MRLGRMVASVLASSKQELRKASRFFFRSIPVVQGTPITSPST